MVQTSCPSSIKDSVREIDTGVTLFQCVRASTSCSLCLYCTAAGRRISGEIDRICPVLKRISVDTNETRTNSEDGDDKKEIVRIPCDVCGLVFSNEEQAEVHFRGMKHNKRLKLEQTKKEGEHSVHVIFG